MAKVKVDIGRVPQSRGEYVEGKAYKKDNIVTRYGSAFQCVVDSTTTPPATIDASGRVTLGEGWIFFADASGVQEVKNAVEATNAKLDKLAEEVDRMPYDVKDDEADLDIGDTEGYVICRIKDGYVKTKNFDSSAFHRCAYIPKLDTQKSEFRWLDLGNSLSYCAMKYLRYIAISQGVDLANIAVCSVSRQDAYLKDYYNVLHNKDTRTSGLSYDIAKEVGDLAIKVKGHNYSDATNYTEYDGELRRVVPLHTIGTDGSLIDSLLTDNDWDLITIHQKFLANYLYDESEGWTKDLDSTEHSLCNNTSDFDKLIRLLRVKCPKATIGYLAVGVPFGQKDGDSSPSYSPLSLNDTLKSQMEWNKCYHKMTRDSGIDIVIPCGAALNNLRVSSICNLPREGFDEVKSDILTRQGFNYDLVHTAFGAAGYVMSAVLWETILAPKFGKSIVGNTLRELAEDDINTQVQKYLIPSYTDNEGSKVIIDESEGAWNKPLFIGVTSSDGGTTWNYAASSGATIRLTEDVALICQKAAVCAVNDMWNNLNPDKEEI